MKKTNAADAGLILAGVFLWLAGCATETNWRSGARKAEPEKAAVVTPAKAHVENDAAVQAAAAEASAPFEGTGWKSLFDGQTLKGLQITDFAGRGAVGCEGGMIVMESGDGLTGVNWTNDVPTVNYEIALDAIKLQGSDFFCGLTFPVKDSWCSLILGGWGGTIVGLSSIDGMDASENETTQFMKFDPGKWHRVRVRVTDTKIAAWLDGTNIVDLATKDRKISLRFGEIELSKPLGVATYETRGAIREIKIRKLEGSN